ncbi:SDR family NAD(P)-dependent oxidoreductase [Prauserella muralis]|uniref:3-oxoacyl-ACP reductase n=1 Tax=Prauserella muralis TaxID=588067 RepID=A0A2V4ALR6_9PSEU|nr:SDR family oxidoreductase [Prauserella muralis]PXY21241.1 3-oxoacyl-ACP reductase [Prauserella muralis]TWE30351.1 3-oxoacyl-[acyl-carrier protein] reductase [Prauserella muralis]
MENRTSHAGVALVTGASRGLGAAIARALARDGVPVAINFARNKAAADALREEIAGAGGRAEVFPADITDEAAVAELCRRVTASLGEIDILVLNATGPQPLLDLEELDWRAVLDQLEFFVKSPLLLAKQVVPGMKRRGYGRIVHVGSEVVELGVPHSSAYVAAKGAQLGLMRSWARELAGHGITVNLVAPGWIPTERHDGVSADEVDRYAAGVPLGHLGVPMDVGEAVAFLASGRAGFITGQRLAVNGGNTLS